MPSTYHVLGAILGASWMYHLTESSGRPREGGTIIIPISQANKLRPERPNNLLKVTGWQVAQLELQGALGAAPLIAELLLPINSCPPVLHRNNIQAQDPRSKPGGSEDYRVHFCRASY